MPIFFKRTKKRKKLRSYECTKFTLGRAYMNLPTTTSEEKAKNVRKAVEFYQAALEIYSKGEYESEYYAYTYHNLGKAYMKLPFATPKEQAQNIQNALECYRAALKIYDKDENQLECAEIKHLLGLSYMIQS